jgi:hypothetical protein
VDVIIERLTPRGPVPFNRKLFLAVLEDVREWPGELEVPEPGFIVLTTHDTRNLSGEELSGFAGTLLDQGACYACCAGPDGDRVHLAFDVASIDRDVAGASLFEHVMTSTNDESLDEAIWFALFAAWTPDCPDADAVLVTTDGEQASQVRQPGEDMPHTPSRDPNSECLRERSRSQVL